MKTAIVTGGGHGIGKSIVKKLSDEQCQVIALDSNKDYLSELRNEYPQSEVLLCDAGHPDEVQKTMKYIESLFGKIDYLVNNAGISVFEPIETLSVETWNRIISVNLGMYFLYGQIRQTAVYGTIGDCQYRFYQSFNVRTEWRNLRRKQRRNSSFDPCFIR
jgi:NAD(P)-dependent dehydrogenase (short-subunit alcohol dehydrogenase family)